MHPQKIMDVEVNLYIGNVDPKVISPGYLFSLALPLS